MTHQLIRTTGASVGRIIRRQRGNLGARALRLRAAEPCQRLRCHCLRPSQPRVCVRHFGYQVEVAANSYTPVHADDAPSTGTVKRSQAEVQGQISEVRGRCLRPNLRWGQAETDRTRGESSAQLDTRGVTGAHAARDALHSTPPALSGCALLVQWPLGSVALDDQLVVRVVESRGHLSQPLFTPARGT